MINPSRVLNNPRFRQSFEVYRSYGVFGPGGWTEIPQSPPSFSVSGVIYPSSAKEIEQVAEADRVQGMMTFVTKTEIYMTRTEDGYEGNSDQLEWRNEKYKVVQLMPWNDYGFNFAVAARLKGR
jgi:hypothetical protein